MATAKKRSKNLKPPINKRSPKEQKTICKRGGEASGKARRKKKELREQLDYLMSLANTGVKNRREMARLGIDENEMNNQMAMNVALFKKALKGDVRAYLAIRDTLGQNPDKPQAKSNTERARKVVIIDDLPEAD